MLYYYKYYSKKDTIHRYSTFVVNYPYTEHMHTEIIHTYT